MEHVQDPFEAMMQAEFGANFGAAEMQEPGVQLTPEQIDAEVAQFSAELNNETPVSVSDREFLEVNGITSREMTEGELAIVALNEERARRAAAMAAAAEFAIAQSFSFAEEMTGPTTDRRSRRRSLVNA